MLRRHHYSLAFPHLALYMILDDSFVTHGDVNRTYCLDPRNGTMARIVFLLGPRVVYLKLIFFLTVKGLLTCALYGFLVQRPYFHLY